MSAMENKKYTQKKKPKQYPLEIKREALDLFSSCLEEYGTKKRAAQHAADLLGIGCADTVLSWARQIEVDEGCKSGTTTEDNNEIKRLRRENAELKRANGILKAASAFFAAELDRPLNK